MRPLSKRRLDEMQAEAERTLRDRASAPLNLAIEDFGLSLDLDPEDVLRLVAEVRRLRLKVGVINHFLTRRP